jgi:hypothetical protein
MADDDGNNELVHKVTVKAFKWKVNYADEGAARCRYASRTTERLHHVSGIPTDINLASHRPLCHYLVADVSATTSRSLGDNLEISCRLSFYSWLSEDVSLRIVGKF